MDETHPDFLQLATIRTAIFQSCGGPEKLNQALPVLITDAVDFVIDPVRTARTQISELDNVEKTFIGLKIEHFLRDYLDFPKGIRDLRIGDTDVDVKNTVRKTWMIPPETYRTSDPCLLIMTATDERVCSMGLILAKEEYLNKPNRDAKRSVSATAFDHILWLVQNASLPDSRWAGFDMERFRELRKIKPGAKRAAIFFEENLQKVVHRSLVQSLLHDHYDYMKRIRWNGGARDILESRSIAIFSGIYHKYALTTFGLAACATDEFLSYRYSDTEREFLKSEGYFDKKNG